MLRSPSSTTVTPIAIARGILGVPARPTEKYIRHWLAATIPGEDYDAGVEDESPSTASSQATSVDITTMAIFESSKDIYERVCRLGKLPAPADDDLLDCVKKIGLIQNRLGRRYFIFGGTSCKMLAGAMRDTANVNIVLEKGSLKIPNPRDWLEQEPFFWSQQEEKYVFVVLRDSHVDGSQPDILCQGRCFVELKVRGAGRRFDDIHKDLVTLPGTSAKSLPRCELLKLKMSGWALKSRREGPKRKNDMIDILALRTTMSLEGERLDLTVGGMYATRAGLSEWLREFDDFKAWPLLLHTGRGNISQDASKSIAL